MSFNVKIKVDQNIKNFAKYYVPSKNEMDSLAEELQKKIVTRTRLGKGIVDRVGSQKQITLKKLSDPYIDFRKKYKNKLSELTKPNKSNATLSGQLLDGVYVIAKSAFELVVGARGKRRKFLQSDKSTNNEEVLNEYEKNGRLFLGLSLSEKNFFLKGIKQIILNKVR